MFTVSLKYMDDIYAFIRSQPVRSFSKDHILLYPNETPEAVYLVRSGYIKIHDVSADGSEQLVWLAKEGDAVPLEYIFTPGEIPQFFYTAHTDLEVHAVERAALLQTIKQRPEATLQMMRRMTDKYSTMLHHLNAAQKQKAYQKVVYALYFVASRFGTCKRRETREVEVPLTHQDIANLVGIARETATHELKRLKDDGCIDYDKSSFFIYLDKLKPLLH